LYKKILLFLMLVDCACRGCAIIVLPMLGELHLPVFLIALSALITVLGIGLIVKFVRSGLRLAHLALFHLCSIGSAAASLVSLWFWPINVPIIETLITGSLLTILVNGTFLALAYHKKHYLTVQQRTQQLPAPKEQTPPTPPIPPVEPLPSSKEQAPLPKKQPPAPKAKGKKNKKNKKK